ncbi:MAG: hypothetical protein ABF301_03025 [Sulfurovum sp.]|nr:MAG: Uncharacterised protein [Arcobacter lacus]
MEKINIKDLKIKFDLTSLMSIGKESKVIVDNSGEVLVNEDLDKSKIIIAKLDNFKNQYLDVNTLAKHNFDEYKPNIMGTICELNPVHNWNAIIELNKNQFLYYDHQSDGVEIFEDALMEDIGWNASPLEISYRDITEYIEDNCSGALMFYDNGVQFNGFAVINDIEDVREKCKKFICEKAKENIEAGIVDVDDDDVIESMEFFGIKG